jgi:outer membrane protein assembly factor BamB
LIDGGGDGESDVAGLSRTDAGAHAATAVDGASGEPSWSVPVAPGARVLCGDARAVLVATAKGKLAALDARTGASRWATTLPDDAEETRAGDGCVIVRLTGGAEVGLDLGTGEPAACSAPVKAGLRTGTPRRWTAHEGDVEIAVEAREVSASTLGIEATRPGASLWRDELPLAVEAGEEPFLGVRDGRVIVGAMDPALCDRLVFVRKDLATGRTTDVRREDARGSPAGFRAALGTRWLFVTWADALAAYDAASGERVWRVGGR